MYNAALIHSRVCCRLLVDYQPWQQQSSHAVSASFSAGGIILLYLPGAPLPARGDYTHCLSKCTQHNLSVPSLNENSDIGTTVGLSV